MTHLKKMVKSLKFQALIINGLRDLLRRTDPIGRWGQSSHFTELSLLDLVALLRSNTEFCASGRSAHAKVNSACAQPGAFSKHRLSLGTRRGTRHARPAARGVQPRGR